MRSDEMRYKTLKIGAVGSQSDDPDAPRAIKSRDEGRASDQMERRSSRIDRVSSCGTKFHTEKIKKTYRVYIECRL